MPLNYIFQSNNKFRSTQNLQYFTFFKKRALITFSIFISKIVDCTFFNTTQEVIPQGEQ